MSRALATLALVAGGCGGHSSGLSPEAPEHLDGAPLVLVVLDSGAVLDWQRERDEALVERLSACLPAALAPVCPEIRVRPAAGGEAAPHVVLDVETVYAASAHFMYGFTLTVTYVMRDRAATAELMRFIYVNEPHTKVMAEEDGDPDEVLTYEAALTAGTLCEDVALQAADIAKGGP